MRTISAAALFVLVLSSSAEGIIAPRNGDPMPKAYFDVSGRHDGAFRLERAWTARAAALARARRAFLSHSRELHPYVPRALQVSGTFAVPVLLAAYQNRPPAYDSAELQRELFDGPWPTGTLAEYYDEVSYGALNVTGAVRDWFTVSNIDYYYEGTTNGLEPGEARTGEFIKEILDAADVDIDFGLFDNDGPDGIPNSGDDDGFVDLLAIVHSETGGECGGNNMWSHSWLYQAWPIAGNKPYTTNDPSASGGFIRANDYSLLPARACGYGIIEIGPFAHELGHAFGIPDLFDPKGGGGGVGHWDIMGRGYWNMPNTPAHPSAWTRKELGWLVPTDIGWQETISSLPQIETSPAACRLAFTDDRFRVMEGCAIDGAHSLRCGLTSGEAAARNWAGGEGYGNGWREVAEREFTFNGSTPVVLSYDYMYHTEYGYDFVYVLIESGGTDYYVSEYTGMGSGHESIDLTAGLQSVMAAPPPGTPAEALPAYSVKFMVQSDEFFSDEDGGYLSDCGAFVLDNVSLTGGGENYSTDFENGTDGWHQDPFENPPTEYFLIENRQPVGFDRMLHGGGVLIWHVDEDVIRSKLVNSGGEGGTAVRGLVLEEADGRGDLIDPLGNLGDDGDPFPGSTNSTVFNGASTPNSNDNTGRPTLVEVIVSGPPDSAMSASLKAGDPPPTVSVVAPANIDNDQVVVAVVIGGSGIRVGATFCFTKSGEDDIEPVSVEWEDQARIWGTIPVYSRGGGDWDLILQNPDGQEVTLPGAITIHEIVAATLASASIAVTDLGVEIQFTVFHEEDGEEFIVSRSASADGAWLEHNGLLESVGEGAYRYVDSDVAPGTTYYYKLDVRSADGDVRELYRTTVTVPSRSLELGQNFPNPFNPVTTIPFYLPAQAPVSLQIFTVSGALVRTLAAGVFSTGPHKREWDGRDNHGQRVASGVYIYRLKAGKNVLKKKLLLLK